VSDSHDTPASNPWWQGFFDDDYAAYGLSDFDADSVRQHVDFLVDVLELEDGLTLLDQCCGVGRLSIPLADRGVNVIGMDITESYVEVARNRAGERNLPCTFHHGDAREFVASEPCDAAINWFTSFGYEEDDRQNIKMLERVFESLKPGGRFALDYLNTARVMAEFRQWYIDRPESEELSGLIVLHETKTDYARGMMESDWTFLYPDGRRVVKDLAVRMYMPHELVAMLRQCGFIDIELFGSVEKEPMDRLSRRCIVVSRKPGG